MNLRTGLSDKTELAASTTPKKAGRILVASWERGRNACLRVKTSVRYLHKRRQETLCIVPNVQGEVGNRGEWFVQSAVLGKR